jgi:3-deoxy-D-manno-octulosonate 8-phosphate phosphatase (KDO 8-P phosphatase)
MDALTARARDVRLLMLDVDGVLTDGRLSFTTSGEEIKAFHVHDGHGLKLLRATGVEVAIVTARRSPIVERRAAELGIGHLYQGAEDKRTIVDALLAKLGIQPREAAYMGDDVVDLPAMRRCGLVLTVPDAPALVKRHAHYVARHAGGAGAVREACELIMSAQGTLEIQLAKYLQ